MLCNKFSVRHDGSWMCYGERALISLLCREVGATLNLNDTYVGGRTFKVIGEVSGEPFAINSRNWLETVRELATLGDGVTIDRPKKVGSYYYLSVLNGKTKLAEPEAPVVEEEEAFDFFTPPTKTELMEQEKQQEENVETPPSDTETKQPNWEELEKLEDTPDNKLMLDKLAKDYDIKLDRRGGISKMLKVFKEKLNK